MLEQGLLITVGVAFLIAVALSPIFIPFLRRLKFGQSIRDEGPKSHQKKSGTPTMGGIVIYVSMMVTTLIMAIKFDYLNAEVLLLLFVTFGYGLIGFLDDYIKVVKKRNLGLTSKQKLIGQLIIAFVFCFFYDKTGGEASLRIPGLDTESLGTIGYWIYIVFVIFLLVGTSNAVNLTDGLDGLLSGTAAIAFGAFSIIAVHQEQYSIAIFCMAVVGATLGFLVFNANPAKVFMGDTGSLALGGALATVAILLKQELLLAVIGGVFVMETLSVIIQVISFKTTGKRVFKMSPLHHHYELCGWSEWRVVVTFWSVGFLLAVLGIYIGVWM